MVKRRWLGSCMYQMNFSMAMLPMQSKWPNSPSLKALYTNTSFKCLGVFFFHILFPAEGYSDSKKGKLIKIKTSFKLDLLLICIEYRYINHTPRQWSMLRWVYTYPLYKEEAHKSPATWYMLYLCSLAWSGYGYRTWGRMMGPQDTGITSFVFSQ